MTDLGPALTLGQMVDRAAARWPDRTAVVFKHERITYADLKRRADDFARGLLALGLRAGDHVVLWMPNRVEWNVANLGIAKIGAVTVTCNSRYKAFEVEYVLRQSDAKAYNKPEATAQKIRDGWLHTGDMAVKDADGYVRITGRLTDMIIVGGFNTYPAEIEDFFLRHPKVLDVSIVGVPDAIMGEAVMAFVIPKEGASLTAEEVVAFARGKIANFKVPKYVEIVDRFPLTGSGKVQKFKQKAYAVAKYQLKEPGN